MADVIDYEIVGDDLQAVIVELDPGEGIQAEVGTMLSMEDGLGGNFLGNILGGD